LLIILAILAGGAWFVFSSRRDAEKNCRDFARQVAERMAVNYDEKYLHVNLSPTGQAKYLPSLRERMITRLREYGTPAQPIEMKGTVTFTNYFFKPQGEFRAQLNYPNKKAYLDIAISSGMTVWQIDDVYLNEETPPAPAAPVAAAATATPSPTASPTPSPTPEQKRKRRR
jgi:hypothetical protein